ncbi:hypothetical protein AGDE_00646 [Angomonas deanei]|nr:hypothetical protein AGDE_02066 [Angomonas deanei]EPY43276.1 hypothetical protein AGDE_00646 [Angomonas deanei]|eukprot:EPY41857.1 hypothetical protein AGDE_02066 [Angomonas deanei]
MSNSSYNAFNEHFVCSVLRQSDASVEKTDAIVKLIVRHIVKVNDSWSAIRKCLAEQVDLDSRTSRAVWNVTDSLLKAVPHVFVPLMAPRLHEYSVNYLPWDLVQWDGRKEAGKRTWCEVMVQSWSSVLPKEIYTPIRQHALQCRSEADLNSALFAQQQNTAAENEAATPAQLQELTEHWDHLKYFCNAFIAEKNKIATRNILQSEVEPVKLGSFTHAEGDSIDTKGPQTTEEDSDEYSPNYVADATGGKLPKLDIKMKRKARKREREDDDL